MRLCRGGGWGHSTDLHVRISVGVGLLVLIVACGFPQPKDVGGDAGPSDAAVDSAVEDAPADAAIDAPPGPPCDLFMQTGCSASEKCTYIRDQMNMETYHVGCAPSGAVANGGACTFTPNADSYDDCLKGSFCYIGKCTTLCDLTAADSCGSAAVCGGIAELAGAGKCIARCNPLDDNIFKTGGTKPGSACASNEGCYGAMSGDISKPTTFTCAENFNSTERLVHRTQCTDATRCSLNGVVFLNSCSPGYEPMLKESTAVSTTICVAFCKPAPCYQGNCGTNGANAAGALPHRCSTTDADGTFDTATATNNGEHCAYSWFWELDQQGNLVQLLASW